LICEVQLVPQIVNGAGLKLEMIMLKEISPVEKVVHFLIHLPWPFHSRDCVIHFQAFDMMEDKQILIRGRSIEEFPGLVIPSPPNNTRRVGKLLLLESLVTLA